MPDRFAEIAYQFAFLNELIAENPTKKSRSLAHVRRRNQEQTQSQRQQQAISQCSSSRGQNT